MSYTTSTAPSLDLAQAGADLATNPYQAYEMYRVAGWLGTLPIPYKKKTFPPSGFTGEQGKFPTDAQCTAWLSEYKAANIALRVPEGLIGIDVDQYVKDGRQKRGADKLREMAEREGLSPLPATWSSTRRDPDGPARIQWFRVPKGIKFDGQPVEDVEIVQYGHRYAMVWPSVVPGDEPGEWTQYAWYDSEGGEASRIPAPDEMSWLPADWVEALREAEQRPSRGSTSSGGKSTSSLAELLALPADDPGRNNAWLAKVAGHLARLHEDDRDTYWFRLEEADQASTDPHHPTKFRKTANSVWKTHQKNRETRKMTSKAESLEADRVTDDGTYDEGFNDDRVTGYYEPTHVGLARRLKDEYGANLRYVIGRGWLGWNGRKWVENNSMVFRAVHDMTDRMLADAKRIEEEDQRSSAVRFVRSMQQTRNIRGIIEQASHMVGVQVSGAVFDADPYKLLVGNGVVDLRTGELLPNRREFMITKGTTVDYDPRAECPRWEAFLKWAFKGDADLVDYVQRMVGDILIGHNDGQRVYFLYGPGGNGKSQLIDVIGGVMGDYYTVALPDLLTAQAAATHTEAEANLAGSRMVAISETRKGQVLDESRVNRLSGDKRQRASRKGEKAFEFPTTFTLVMYGNVRPTIPFTEGVKRRFKVFKMDAKVNPAERVDDLSGLLLREEGPAILAWAVRGAVRVASGEKIGDPPSIKKELTAWERETNPAGDFVEAYLIPDADAKVTNDDLWDAYGLWKANGNRDFAKNVSQLGGYIMDWAASEDIEYITRPKSPVAKVNGKPKRGIKGLALNVPSA
ncbi:phage/plasmid primase, P4 family [Streptomyces sp. NPDC048521]|uniref:phage/plasmid primase, P4 family n=1 Tax=Streptomyces sp. NPDC048521 TaxID=3365566 RepID=UPI00371EED9A